MKSSTKKMWTIVLTACLLAVTAVGSVPAATTKSKTITSVTIRVGHNIEAGDMLPDDIDVRDNLESELKEDEYDGAYVGTNSPKYYVRDAEWVTSSNRVLKIADEPRMRITLETTGEGDVEYTFRSSSYSSSNISVKGGTFYSAKRINSSTLEVVVTLSGVKGTYSEPTDATWKDKGLGKAIWYMDYDSDDDYYKATATNYYDIYLYRGTAVIKRVENYRGTSYDFYPYMTKKGTYYYKVRAVPHTDDEKKYGKKSDWTESDEIYIEEKDVSDGTGQEEKKDTSSTSDNNNTNNSSTGPSTTPQQQEDLPPADTTKVGWVSYNNNWFFRYPTGTYFTNGWLKLNDIWYLFDKNGKMLTGWQQDKDSWYFLDANGAMRTGWIKGGNKWYYLNTAKDGYVEGTMRTGWLVQGDKRYYLESDGTMAEGWKEIDGKYYYFYPGYGYMATNTTIDGFFKLDQNGVWIP